MNRTECGSCGSRTIHGVVDLGKTPVANTFPWPGDPAPDMYPLGMVRCLNCGLAQSSYVVPDDVLYGDTYGFYSGGSAAQRRYHERAADHLLTTYPDQAAHGVLEIACNDGSLLRHLAAVVGRDRAVGVDPSAPAEEAQAAGLNVLRESFTSDLAARMDRYGLVVMFNALAHVADLNDVLTGIRTVLRPDGVAVVEVQYLADLVTGNMIGQIYHEHRFYWSLGAFIRAAGNVGLSVVDARRIELQGGGLRIVMVNRPGEAMSRAAYRILEAEEWLRYDAPYAGIQGRFDRIRDHTVDLIAAERDGGRSVGGYAAAAKAVTMVHYFGLDLPFVIDTTPHKWGRVIPGTSIPIVHPAFTANLPTRASTRVLFAGNYLGHVLRADPAYLNDGGRWLVVEPAPMVI